MQFAEALTGALDWWRDAGVDSHFVDEPLSWLAPPPVPDNGDAPRRPRTPANATNAAMQEKASSVPLLTATNLPADLAAFMQWWETARELETGGTGPRVAPVGTAGAPLMVLVDMPEATDTETLLGAQQGALLDAMLAAFGLTRDDIYLASVLPRHAAVPDWQTLAKGGLGAVTAHHIALAAPQRLMILGGHILPLIGHEPPQRTAVLRELNHEGGTIPLLASWGLSALLQRAGGKAALWRTWLEWTAA